VTVQGATFSQEAVARVLSRLALVPALEDVRLATSAVVDPQVEQLPAAGAGDKPAPAKKGKRVVTFTITASLRSRATS
jgi:hypothetical protein